jgi:hypothetical protein
MIYHLLFCFVTVCCPLLKGWRTFLKHDQQQMLACDCFTIETVRLETLYVLFFIELGSRHVYLAGCTKNPERAWVTQQARQLVWHLDDEAQTSPRFLIHDRNSQFTGRFDQVFVSEDIKIVRTVRQECLDQLLIFNQRQLVHVLKEYTHSYNTARRHQGRAQQIPIPLSPPQNGTLHCRAVLGGILHDSYRHAA